MLYVYIYIYIYICIYIYTRMCEFTEGSTPTAPKPNNYLVLGVEVWKAIKNPLAAPSLKSAEALEVPAARVTMWGRCWSLSRKQGGAAAISGRDVFWLFWSLFRINILEPGIQSFLFQHEFKGSFWGSTCWPTPWCTKSGLCWYEQASNCHIIQKFGIETRHKSLVLCTGWESLNSVSQIKLRSASTQCIGSFYILYIYIYIILYYTIHTLAIQS